ncbi:MULTISPECIES: DsbA family protein [Aurantimonas]|jgi:protein-disulfide isomerase|uniref:DsbA family protein n=1 Tax=Aurantimonas TaxID=182269 RepID=UPI00165262C3|nr:MULTISPECIES: DsbA family protein [Aurantimonas]MBC6716996.1 DsbA family protein [Aurantimonas sp. DM33-3]MCC4298117.1 DsbA family protein [Aurantimonas coralicida]MCD1641742.1 DsbA family protein [Aurantimonas coralicida]MCW7542682.1 DsbA family protein [Aurantimonas litoralis]
MTHPLTARTRLAKAPRIAAFLAGAGLLAIAGCTDEAESTAASAVLPNSDAVLMAQADTAPATPATPAVEAPESSGSVDVADLMAEGPLPDVVIGDADAPVTIVEYASMTCSHCADFHENSYPQIKTDFLDTGKAKLIIREFPFDPRALAGFMLARCTGDDAKRTAMIDVLFSQQDDWARADNASAALLKIAKLAGMSQDEFTSCLNDKEMQEKIVEIQQKGQNEFGVNATPTFFINGDKFSGALSAEQMAAAIRARM